MVLLNAVYFKGNWKDKFDEKLTKPKPFHVDKTTTIQVPTMYIKKKFFYKELQELNAECIALPYEVNIFTFNRVFYLQANSMYILLADK